MVRSLLFVPGDSPRKFERALASEAEALILDLEDSVLPAEKAGARAAVAAMLAREATAKPLWVRVNALDSGLMLDDLAAVMPGRPHGVVVPKCAGRETLLAVAHYLDALEAVCGIAPGATRILAIATETAHAMFGMDGYANVTERLWGIAWGGEDLAADIGALANRAEGRYTEPYRLARTLCLYAAAAAGVHAIDAVCVELEDDCLAQTEAATAFRDGFAGKMAIHPKHVPAIHRGFAPDAALLRWAGEVVAALDGPGKAGAARVDGRMVDQPHLRLARKLLARGGAA